MPGAWETEAEWRRLTRELAAWRDRRVRADALGQHRSQLESVCTLLDRVLGELRVPMASMTGDDAAILQQSRVHDRRLMWVRRLWDFFRDRFDQRDDPTLAPVLHGADEVVWSCMREPALALAAAGAGPDGPPPLPYVEPALTPEVFPHGLVPGTLRRDIDAPFLRQALDALPFAVVRVPASCVTAPWWLVHLGHEVGHVADAQWIGYPTRTAVVESVTLDAQATADWTRWSGEVFADAYAALMHGQWALWALAVAETHDATALVQPRDTYPPPVVRLLVMAHACAVLRTPTTDVAADVARWQAVVDGDPRLAAMTADGRRVVEALLQVTVRRLSLPALAAWDPASWDRAALRPWVSTLPRRPATPSARPRRAWARSLVAASVLRRKDGQTAPTGLQGEAIADDLLTWLPAVREPGSRASRDDVAGRVAAQGVTLARDLMDAEPLP